LLKGGNRNLPFFVSALLAAGAKADYRYGPGSTPLHEAVASGNSQLVKLLLDHGADPNARTNDGQIPLALAESRGHREICALLRQRAASA
jgi:ankyrin repeat protein